MAAEHSDCPRAGDLEEIQEKEWIELPESSPEDHLQNDSDQQLVTMTGTVTRGYQAGQLVEVQLQLTQDELRKMTLERDTKNEDHDLNKSSKCSLGLHSGPHILLLGILCMPFALIFSTGYSFYIGCNTWYNIHLYFFEDKTIWHKISICPVLILTFPFTIGLSAFAIGLYGTVIQISWYFYKWLQEFQDYEKGFYGWLCNRIQLPQCSPYEIVVLDCPESLREIKDPSTL